MKNDKTQPIDIAALIKDVRQLKAQVPVRGDVVSTKSGLQVAVRPFRKQGQSQDAYFALLYFNLEDRKYYLRDVTDKNDVGRRVFIMRNSWLNFLGSQAESFNAINIIYSNGHSFTGEVEVKP
jgi:hypothetical protein